ncbi:ABC transporter permease [Chloroflexi bacterium]|nr:ABC transporter permease [Chloroflexota bacterium]
MGIVFLILVVWEALVKMQDIPSWLLPPPSAVAITIYSDYSLLARHTLVTMQEIILGFFVALAVGVFFASAICLSRTIERALYPFIIASQTVPVIVIAPMLLVWIGYGLAPKVIVVALISFFPIVVNTVDGMKSIDPDVQKLMYTLGSKKSQIFSKVMIPSSLPYLFSGLRVAIAISVIGAVIGEWVGSSEGLGYLMIRSKPQFQTERVFAAIVILSFIGVALFSFMTYLEKIFVPWSTGRRV